MGAFGRILVKYGPMYSGKSWWLIRQYQNAQRLHKPVQSFNHVWDARYGTNAIIVHADDGAEQIKVPAMPVETAYDIDLNLKPETQVLIIDEGNFFDTGLVELLYDQYMQGKNLFVGTLDKTFDGELFPLFPFGTAADLIFMSTESISAEHGQCMFEPLQGERCGKPATLSYRFRGANKSPVAYGDRTIVPGGEEAYEARCLAHHKVADKEEHYAVLDAVRILHMYKSFKGNPGIVALNELLGFSAQQFDDIQGEFHEHSVKLAGELQSISPVRHPEEYSVKNMERWKSRACFSFMYFFHKPMQRMVRGSSELEEVSRFELFDRGSLGERINTLIEKRRLIALPDGFVPL